MNKRAQCVFNESPELTNDQQQLTLTVGLAPTEPW